jgi:hypothetical protein
MPELIALRAVFGQDEANHGTRRYRVDGDGLVHVPPEAVAFLISKGGFVVAKATTAAAAEAGSTAADPDCLVRLHHDAAGGCSYAGCEYPSDENGDVLVPPQAVADLIAHGFVPVPEEGLRNGSESAQKPAGSQKSAPAAKPRMAARMGRG